MAKFLKLTGAPGNEVLYVNFDLVVFVYPRTAAGRESGAYVVIHGEKQRLEVRETAERIVAQANA